MSFLQGLRLRGLWSPYSSSPWLGRWCPSKVWDRNPLTLLWGDCVPAYTLGAMPCSWLRLLGNEGGLTQCEALCWPGVMGGEKAPPGPSDPGLNEYLQTSCGVAITVPISQGRKLRFWEVQGLPPMSVHLLCSNTQSRELPTQGWCSWLSLETWGSTCYPDHSLGHKVDGSLLLGTQLSGWATGHRKKKGCGFDPGEPAQKYLDLPPWPSPCRRVKRRILLVTHAHPHLTAN